MTNSANVGPNGKVASTPSFGPPEATVIGPGNVPEGFTALSPDALIAFVEMNLRSDDTQIQKLMDQVTATKKRIEALNKISADIREMKGESFDVQKTQMPELTKDLEAAGFTVTEDSNGVFKNVTTKDPDLQGVIGELNDIRTGYDAHTLDGEKMSDALEGHAAKLDAIANNLSGSSEILMIQLQNLIQDRTRTVQFASNTLSAINDAEKTPINNIAR